MIKKTEESFGGRIRRLREAKGLSMEVLSHDTGYTVDFLKEIEEGKIAPPVAVVLQLGRVLKVDMDQFQETRDKEASRKRTTSHKKRVASYAYEPLTTTGRGKTLKGLSSNH